MRAFLETLPPEAILGELHAKRFRVALTSEDALWCARALVGEAGEDAAQSPEGGAVLATWIRRFSMLNDSELGAGRAAHWSTLTELVRAHSQPVNPRWSEGGDLAELHPERADAAHLRRRERIQSLTWSQIPAGIRALVLDTLSGAVRRLGAPTSVDFAAPSLLQRAGADWSTLERRLATFPHAVQTKYASVGGKYVHVGGTGRGSNWFMSTRISRAAGAREPIIVPASKAGGVLPLLGAIVAAILLVGGVA